MQNTLRQFGTQVKKCLQFEWHLNSGPWRQDILYGPTWPWQNFSLCRPRSSQDSRAVGRQPAIPRSLEYRTIVYKTTFVLGKLWRHVSDENYKLLCSVKAHVPTHREGRKELWINGSSDLADLRTFREDSQIDFATGNVFLHFLLGGGRGGGGTQERFSNFSNKRFFQPEKLPEKLCQQGRIW